MRAIVDAKLSMPFGAALVLLYGKADRKGFQVSMIQSQPVSKRDDAESGVCR